MCNLMKTLTNVTTVTMVTIHTLLTRREILKINPLRGPEHGCIWSHGYTLLLNWRVGDVMRHMSRPRAVCYA